MKYRSFEETHRTASDGDEIIAGLALGFLFVLLLALLHLA